MSTTYVPMLVYGTFASKLEAKNIDTSDFYTCEEFDFCGIPVDHDNGFQDFLDENEISKSIQSAKDKFFKLTGLTGRIQVILFSY